MTWRKITLGDIAVQRGGSVDPKKHQDEVFELYSIPAFDAGTPELASGSEIGSSKKCVQPNDVMVSRIVPHIRRAWVVGPENGRRQIASGEWIIFRSEDVWPQYLRWVLVGDVFHSAFMRTVSGVGGSLLRARPAEVFKIQIPLPPLAEQKRIAGILDAADALRAKRREALAQLDTLLQSTFLDMFGGPVSNANFPSAVMTELVTKFIDYRGKSPEKSETGIPLVTAKIVKEMEVKEPDEFIPTESYDSWMRRGIPNPGDVIITTEAPMGEVALVPSYKAAYAQRLLVLQPDKTKVESIYLMWALTMPFVIQQLRQRSTGSTVTGIRSKEFKKVSLPLPRLGLQRSFVAIVESVEQQKARMRGHLAELDALFASLQSLAFNGEL